MADPVQRVPAPPPPAPPEGPAVPQTLQQPAALQALQQPAMPHALQQPTALQAPQQMVHLNWSNFEPEFSVKPDEDTEAHLLYTNNWMNTHHFAEGVKVQSFCLTLLGEARLWYHLLESINVNWQGIQNLFRQQYFKIGNTRE